MSGQERTDAAEALWTLQGVAVERVEVVEEPSREEPGRRVKLVYLRDKRKWSLCECGSKSHPRLFLESEPRRFRDCSLGDYETFVIATPYRLRCGKATTVETFPWEAQGFRTTRRFFERVAALCRHTTVSEVARLVALSWDTVARIDGASTRLALGGDEPDLGSLRWIGVDEVSRTGGHVYFTVVTDLISGRVVFLGDGKREGALVEFFEKLGPRRCRRIRGVVSDLGSSYLPVIARFIPHARHVLDRFHIVQWLNEGLNDLRRRIFGGAPKDELGQSLKVKKWILLSARENLDFEHKVELERLCSLNHPLYIAYLLKEQLRAILHHPWSYLGALRRNLVAWCATARGAAPEYVKIANRLEPHLEKVVAGFNSGVRLGFVEATNGKIALIRRQARGYRNIEIFKLKIFQRCSLPSDPYGRVVL